MLVKIVGWDVKHAVEISFHVLHAIQDHTYLTLIVYQVALMVTLQIVEVGPVENVLHNAFNAHHQLNVQFAIMNFISKIINVLYNVLLVIINSHKLKNACLAFKTVRLAMEGPWTNAYHASMIIKWITVDA